MSKLAEKLKNNKQRLIGVLIALIALCSVFFSACSGGIEVMRFDDTDGSSEMYVTVEVDDSYFYAYKSKIYKMIGQLADAYGFEYEAEDNVVSLYKYFPPATDSEGESKKPDNKSFFTNIYKYSMKTDFYGLIDCIMTMGDADAVMPEEDSVLESAIYGLDYMSFEDGMMAMYHADGLYEIIGGDNDMVEKVKQDINELPLYYVFANYYMGFSGGDYSERDADLGFYVWNLTGDANREVEFQQVIPVTATWYALLLGIVGVFVAISIIAIKYSKFEDETELIQMVDRVPPIILSTHYNYPPYIPQNNMDTAEVFGEEYSDKENGRKSGNNIADVFGEEYQDK